MYNSKSNFFLNIISFPLIIYWLSCTKIESPIIGSGDKITILTGTPLSSSILTSVVIAGNSILSNASNIADKERGICWSESPNNVNISSNKIAAGKGIGQGFSSPTITGLLPGKTYYYRAYITLKSPFDTSSLYGEIKQFTTSSICPTFSLSITNRSSTSINYLINISNNGGSILKACGIVYSTTSVDPTIGATDCMSQQYSGMPAIGSLSISVNNLAQARIYYARAWVETAERICYGPISTIPTLANPATLTTSLETNVTTTSASLGAEIISDGGTPITQRGIVISSSVSIPLVLDNNPTVGVTGCNSFIASPSSGNNPYSISISGLIPSTTYFFRAWAKNSSNSISYGQVRQFTTNGNSPTLVGTNNCSTLNGVTSSFEYWNGTSRTTSPWFITNNGQNGECWAANMSFVKGTGPVGTHFVEFTRNFTKNGYIQFWLKAAPSGYNNLFPDIYIDGIKQISPTMIGGQLSSAYFMKVKTGNISAGNRTIKIEFSSSYRDLYIDEIEFFQY